ncbi:MAG: serine/threonine protein kinase [Deltaproteobacteria bacterium]|nr:serine/threonine protein kinase [Deltaproteobacteria bacterium]
MGQPSPAGDPMSLAGQRLGRYEVLTQLASGGMATVYVARAQGVAGFERLVAVKVMHPHMAHEEEFISMFLDEARLAALIRHPNVVPTLDISDTDGRGFYLVMDYVEGDHLGALLRAAVVNGGRLDPGVAVRIMMDALAGLGAAHTLTGGDGQPLRLVHRDISPHNIMVGADGVARLTDFGVAKADVRLSSTREGQFKGKLGYMAPEHASTGLADQRSDLFSMGIVLWECLASKRLFRGENNAATLSKVLNMPVPALADIAPELGVFDPVLSRALARPPEERFESADDFLEALEAAARAGDQAPASARLVAAAVQEQLGEKLETERARIREAIATYGTSSLAETPLPRPSDGSASAKYLKGTVETGPAETMASSPAARAAQIGTGTGTGVGADAEPGAAKRSGWLIPTVLLVLVLGLGAGAFAFLSMAEDEPVQTPGASFEVLTGREITEEGSPTSAPNGPTGATEGAETAAARGSASGTDPGPATEIDGLAAENVPQTAEGDPDDGSEEPGETAAAPRRDRGRRGQMARMVRMAPAGTADPPPPTGTMEPSGTGGDLIANPYTQ